MPDGARFYYFDSAAAPPPDPDIQIDAALFANCDSLHHLGVLSETAFEGAKKTIADNLGALPDEIVFTSGATESNNLAIKGVARRGRVVTCDIEHPSVSECAAYLSSLGVPVTVISANADGEITPRALSEALAPDVVLVSLFYVNAETGVVNDIEKLAGVVKQTCGRALFHTDAAQALGKLPLTLKNVDLASFSAHKIGGPKGAGGLFVKRGLRLNPLIHGGGQQNGMRSGTVDLPAVLAFSRAVELSVLNLEKNASHAAALSKLVKTAVCQIPGVVVNGKTTSPYILNFSVSGVKGEVLLNALSRDNIYVSTGSACHAKRGGKNTIAKFAPERADFAVRVSFSPFNTPDECEILIAAIKKHVAILRKGTKYENNPG